MNDDNAAARQLISAISKNDITTASSLISSGSVDLNDKPWPLHTAARHGRLEIMTLLLDAGADIDLCDNNRWTACRCAIYCDQLDALKLMVERGANLNANNKSLLMFAALLRSDQSIIYLLDVGASIDDLTPFELMSLVRSAAMYERLLARGVNFDAMRDESGCTLCHHVASRVSDENDFRFLVDVCCTNGVDAVNNRGQTPLHWAAQNHNNAAMRMLVELGANIDHQDNYGQAALHTVASQQQRNSLSRLELLLALGADARLVTKQGETAFDLTLHRGNQNAFAFVDRGWRRRT